MSLRSVLPFALALATAACRGGEGDSMAARGGPSGEAGERVAVATEAEEGPTDEALAREGEKLFQAKGCNACHKFGEGRLVGPDLAGVTERREKQWIVSMILHPDSMVRADSIARRLLSEYYTPMQNMGVSREEAEALYHYLRRETEEHGGTS